MRPLTASTSAGLVGPRFEPLDAVALFGRGDVADGRPQKYFGSVKLWPMSSEPTGLAVALDEAAAGLQRERRLGDAR